MTEPSARQVVDAVTAGAHWRVTIRPTVFAPARIQSLGQCWQLMESESVSFRGWDYPHVDHRNRAQGNDWIQSWVTFRGIGEYWRLYQSGLFLHIFGFQEDSLDTEERNRAVRWISIPTDFECTGTVDFIAMLYTMTEVFELASRLGQKGALGDTGYVSVEMRNVANRLLVSHDHNRMVHDFCPATAQIITFVRTASVTELVSTAREAAIDATLHFYERFGAFNVPRALLVDEQAKFAKP